MTDFLTKAKKALTILSGVAFLIYLYKLFKPVPAPDTAPFDKAAEKAVAQEKVSQLKEDLKEVGQEQYTDEEIEKKFNK